MNEHPAFWKSTLGQLQTMTTPEMFKSWLLPLEIVSTEDKTITFRVPTPFFVTFLRSSFEAKIVSALSLTTGEHFRVAYVVGEKQPSETSTANKVLPMHGALSQNNQEPTNRFSNFAPIKQEINREHGNHSGNKQQKTLIKATSGFIDTTHTFDNFIVSGGSQFAHAAAKGVASFPGGKFNPLLIYGPSGLGKTHLLHAIANQLLESNPSAKICYISSESFLNEFIEAIKTKSMNQFHSRYRDSFDVFLVDDIQFIGGKDACEEEFFHTFNHLFNSRHQVVLTSDKAPKELHSLEDRLVTRLQQGLVVDVKPPDLETRVAILKAKAEADDLYIPDDVCFMIAGKIRSNVRELEGALVRLSAEASINGTEISVEMAKEALADLFSDNRSNTTLSIDSINKCVCQYFKINSAELNSKSRARKYSEPRQIAMYLCRKYAKRTFPEIAAAFGGKDHTTVMYAINKIEREIHTSPTLKKYVEDIQQML
jgi:chromosomal replication initiator protein